MYAFRNDIKQKKVCQGIKRCNIEKMKFEMYKNCLIDSQVTTETVHNITSKGLHLYTTKTQKTQLSPYDDKRYLIDNMYKYTSIWT